MRFQCISQHYIHPSFTHHSHKFFCRAGDYKVVRDASVRFERWAYSVAVHFDPQGEHADADLRKVQLLLGPYHWALHFMLTRQNGKPAALAFACGIAV
jgi:hypothetical protein